jgi:hypothetical protein
MTARAGKEFPRPVEKAPAKMRGQAALKNLRGRVIVFNPLFKEARAD